MDDNHKNKPYIVDRGGVSRYAFLAYIIIVVIIAGFNLIKPSNDEIYEDSSESAYNEQKKNSPQAYTYLTTPDYILEHIRAYKKSNEIPTHQIVQKPVIKYHYEYYNIAAENEQELLSEINLYSDNLSSMTADDWVANLEFWFDIQHVRARFCSVSDFLVEIDLIKFLPTWDGLEQAMQSNREIWNDFYIWAESINEKSHHNILLAINQTIESISSLEEECNALPLKVKSKTNRVLNSKLYKRR